MRTHRARSLLGLAGLYGLAGLSLGCSGDTTDPVSLPPGQTFWTLQFSQHAVNLALTASGGQPVEDTLHLVATGRNLLGKPLAGGIIQYHSTDSTVTVDSTGLVTARYVTTASGTAVVASQTARGTTLTDTAFVQVTESSLAAPLATMVLRPVNPGNGKVIDSTKVAVDKFPIPQITVFATMATGSAATDTVCNVNSCPLIVKFSCSDTSIATIDQYGDITPIIPGHVTFYADTWAYGVVKRDSLPFVIGYPIRGADVTVYAGSISGHAAPVLSFGPNSITIGITGLVLFHNTLDTPIDVVFDQRSGYTLENNLSQQPNGYTIFPIVGPGAYASTSRAVAQFMAVGTYTYHSRLFGTGGTIIVSAGP